MIDLALACTAVVYAEEETEDLRNQPILEHTKGALAKLAAFSKLGALAGESVDVLHSGAPKVVTASPARHNVSLKRTGPAPAPGK